MKSYVRRLPWACRLTMIAAGCVFPLAGASSAAQSSAGEARIWFYGGYEPAVGYSPSSTPTIVANGTYVGTASSGTAFYRDVPPGRYEITVPNRFGFRYQSAHLDLAAGQEAYVKIIVNRGNNSILWQQTAGFGALLVPQEIALAEIPGLATGSGQP